MTGDESVRRAGVQDEVHLGFPQNIPDFVILLKVQAVRTVRQHASGEAGELI